MFGPLAIALVAFVSAITLFWWLNVEMQFWMGAGKSRTASGDISGFPSVMRDLADIVFSIGFLFLVASDWRNGKFLNVLRLPNDILTIEQPTSFYALECVLLLCGIIWLVASLICVAVSIARLFRGGRYMSEMTSHPGSN